MNNNTLTIIGPSSRMRYLLVLLGTALVLVLAWLLMTPSHSATAATAIDQIDRCIDEDSVRPYLRASIEDMLRLPFTASASCWQAATLPEHVSASGVAIHQTERQLRRVWFRASYRVPDLWRPSDPLAIHVPRIMGAGWLLQINGHTVADNIVEWRMTWNRPLDVQLGHGSFQPGDTIDIALAVVYAAPQGYAMSRITLGPAPSVMGSSTWRHYLQITFPQAASAAMLLLGAFFFSFWLTRPADRAYLWLTWASLTWGIGNLQYVLPRVDDTQRDAWYVAIVQLMPIPWLTWLIYSFVTTFSERRVRWLETLLPVYVLGITLAALPLWHQAFNVDLLILTIYTVVGILTIGVICWMAAASKSIELRVITAVLILSTLAAANDLALVAHRVDPERYFLLPYIGVMLFGAFLYAVQRRYAHAITGHERLSAELSTRLQQREDELTRQHQRVLELERAQTLSLERQRLMRDMHDGIGSSLAASLAVVERGDMTSTAVAQMLRDCVDDLYAIIDSLEPTDKDLVGQLAMLRYRLGKRLDAAGLRVEWVMHDIPPLDWMGPTETLQILRIIQEVLANVIKHAQARCVKVQVAQVADQVELFVQDDGLGFDASTSPPGRGLKYLHRRAAELGAVLTIESSVGSGTQTRLLLDIQRAPDASQGQP